MVKIKGSRSPAPSRVAEGPILTPARTQPKPEQTEASDQFSASAPPPPGGRMPVQAGGLAAGSALAMRSLKMNSAAAHEAITSDLFNGRVVKAEPFGANGNLGKLFKVTLYNEATGRSREALFKPREYGDRGGWCRPPIEYVSYELNRMLDLDLIAPVAYRREIDVAFQHFAEGSMTYVLPDAHRLNKVDSDKWGARKDLFLSDTRVIDVLIQNCDRHPGNFGRGKHWVDGKYRPVLFDQDAGFRRESHVTMDQENAFLTGPTTVVRKRTLDGLKRLSFDEIKTRCGEFISDDEIRGVLQRRDGIVAHFARLSEQKGVDKVVIDDDN